MQPDDMDISSGIYIWTDHLHIFRGINIPPLSTQIWLSLLPQWLCSQWAPKARSSLPLLSGKNASLMHNNSFRCRWHRHITPRIYKHIILEENITVIEIRVQRSKVQIVRPRMNSLTVKITGSVCVFMFPDVAIIQVYLTLVQFGGGRSC